MGGHGGVVDVPQLGDLAGDVAGVEHGHGLGAAAQLVSGVGTANVQTVVRHAVAGATSEELVAPVLHAVLDDVRHHHRADEGCAQGGPPGVLGGHGHDGGEEHREARGGHGRDVAHDAPTLFAADVEIEQAADDALEEAAAIGEVLVVALGLHPARIATTAAVLILGDGVRRERLARGLELLGPGGVGCATHDELDEAGQRLLGEQRHVLVDAAPDLAHAVRHRGMLAALPELTQAGHGTLDVGSEDLQRAGRLALTGGRQLSRRVRQPVAHIGRIVEQGPAVDAAEQLELAHRTLLLSAGPAGEQGVEALLERIEPAARPVVLLGQARERHRRRLEPDEGGGVLVEAIRGVAVPRDGQSARHEDIHLRSIDLPSLPGIDAVAELELELVGVVGLEAAIDHVWA